ncbi:MAG: RsmE family RNA methyltransferase [Bacteriovoracaceae bacterium]
MLLFPHELQKENLYCLKEPKVLKHIKEVLKKSTGDKLSVCIVGSSLGEGVITSLSEEGLTIEVIKTFPGASYDLNLFVAVSRPPTMKKILEHGTSLGVSTFHFYVSALTEKSFLEAKLFRENLYQEYLALGLSQSKVFFKLPEVVLHKKLPLDVEFSKHQKYLLKMQAGTSFTDIPPDLSGPISLVLGPERGLTADENESFISKGFTPIEIGASTLRVEIACFAALAQLQLFTSK